MTDLVAVPSLPGYFADASGNVWSDRSGTMRRLAQSIDHQGYPTVRVFLQRGSRPTRRKVPRIVAEAFIGPRPDGLQIRHLDGDPGNNRPENLRYGTAKENSDDKIRHGTQVFGERSHQARHSNRDVAAAVQMVLDGHSQPEAALRFGVEQATISTWCLGITRRDATAHLNLSGLRGKRARGEHRASTKVNDAQLEEMKRLRARGVKVIVIADTFGVHPATASKLTRGLGRAA